MPENINIPDSNITTELSFRNLILMNMQALTNFPYIENDFDALTDYELLSLVVKYLNDVISNQNEQNASITRLYNSFLALQDYINGAKDEMEDAFNELDTYVRTFFANLDVQEEINNKLDAMVEDGTLADIITNYLNTKALFCYDNVAELKLATNLMDGSYAKTLGFYAINDGGGATYKVRTKTSSDTPNEMDMIAIGDNLVAILNDNLNNCLCYGVKSDDSNNNNHTIIKYVIDNKKSAYIPSDITLTNTLVIDTADVNFKFEKITYTGNSYAILVNTNNVDIDGQYINSNYHGIRYGLDDVTIFCNLKLNRLYVEKTALLFGGTAGVYYINVDVKRITFKEHGVNLLLDNYYVGEISINNASFTDESDETITEQYAIYMNTSNNRCTGLTLNNISFEGCKGGIEMYSTTSKLCEHLFADNIRVSELSYRDDKKVMKITATQGASLYGYMNFDFAKPSSFDFTNYASNYNSGFKLNGVFKYDVSQPKDMIAREGYIGYKSLLLTKLPLVYMSQDTGTAVQYPKAENIYIGYNSSSTTIKIRVGDSYFRYNGTIRLLSLNANVTALEVYANDGTTVIQTITLQTGRMVELNIGSNQYNTSGEMFHRYIDGVSMRDIPQY